MEGDSFDYEVLERAAHRVRDVLGLVCEIGTRRGGSLKYIIDGLEGTRKHIVCIDPYGGIGYNGADNLMNVRYDYTNAMKHESLPQIYNYAASKNVNIVFFNLEDTEFMGRFHDGVPVYDGDKQVLNHYALVFFDGPHDTYSILNEVMFFLPRSRTGSVFVFDDIQTYQHHMIESVLYLNGYRLIEVGPKNRKASYEKFK
jgi:hypothetical protein